MGTSRVIDLREPVDTPTDGIVSRTIHEAADVPHNVEARSPLTMLLTLLKSGRPERP